MGKIHNIKKMTLLFFGIVFLFTLAIPLINTPMRASAVTQDRLTDLSKAWTAFQFIGNEGFDNDYLTGEYIAPYAFIQVSGDVDCDSAIIGRLVSPVDGDVNANINKINNGSTVCALGNENRKQIFDPILSKIGFTPETFLTALGYKLGGDGMWTSDNGGVTREKLAAILLDPKIWPAGLRQGDFVRGIAPPFVQYQALIASLNSCGTKTGLLSVPTTNTGPNSLELVSGNTVGLYDVQIVDDDDPKTMDIGKGIGVPGTDLSYGSISCGNVKAGLIETVADGKTRADYFVEALGVTDAAPPSAVGSGSVLDEEDLCDRLGSSSLRWIMCPIFEMLDGATAWIAEDALPNLLAVNVDAFFSPGIEGAWETFRGFALTLLVVAALFMVISQALGFSFLDAYTIKKILPRLLIAIIGIALSWEIMRFVVQFFNDIGGWIDSIIRGAFLIDTANLPAAGNHDERVGGVVVAAGALGSVVGAAIIIAFTPGGIGAILFTMLLFGMALLTALVVLGVRAAIIGVCIIIAPLAIAAYILPSTKKLWDFWQNTFMTTLLMYPIIMGFLAIGAALSSVIGASNTGWTSGLSILVYFAPYFLLPFAFKLAGGLMKTIFSITDDKNKGMFDRIRKRREHSTGKVKADLGQRRDQFRARTNATLQGASSSSKTAFGRIANKGLARAIGGDNIEARMSAIRAARSKELNEQIQTGADMEIRALSVNKRLADAQTGSFEKDGHRFSGTSEADSLKRVNKNGQREYRTLGGAWVNEAQVDRAHSRWGNDQAAQQTSLSYEMRKASTNEQADSIISRYNNVATAKRSEGGWGMEKGEAGNAWTGAGFENASANLAFKHTDGATGQLKNGGKDLIDEIYENKGSYPLSQMKAHTIGKIQKAYEAADPSTTQGADIRKRIQGVAETFMRDMGSAGGGMVDDGTGTGNMIPNPTPPQNGTQQTGSRQVGANGSAHVNEAVRELANVVGVKWTAPNQGAAPSPAVNITTPPQT